jgi:tetratricopeptide (TPR) repeat protein
MDWYAKFDFDSVQDPVVLYNVGTVCYNASQFEDALKYYRKAVERQKDFLDALYQLGLTCLNLQKREEAVAAFERCLGLVPSDSPRAQQVRGFLEYLKK